MGGWRQVFMGLNSALGHAPYVEDRRSHRAHNLKSEWLEGRDSQSRL